MASEVQAKFGGKWKVYKDENFEAFVDAMGIGGPKNQAVVDTTPIMTVYVEGDTIHIEMEVGHKTNKIKFRLGEEFDNDAGPLNGRDVFTFEGNKLTEIYKPNDATKSELQVEREVVNGEIVQIMTIGSVVAKRFFKKV